MKTLRAFFCLLILINLVFNINPVYASTSPEPYPETNGKAVILMDAKSGRVLYERNSQEQLPPASLTKIMTALLVVENGNLNQKVIISEHAAETPECSVYLESGEVLTRMELLYAAMLPSANDASMALAESVAGDEASFVRLMNQRADELGLKHTHFINPHGLEAEGHYSSACDLALLSKTALSCPVFAQVVETKRKIIPWEGKDEDRLLFNHNRLLNRYDGAIGVKTGYTRQAGNCVVGAAQRGDMVLIAVSMNSPTVYNDLQQMLDYGFEHYKMVTLGKVGQVSGEVEVLDGDSKTVPVTLAHNLSIAATDDELPYLSYGFTLEPTVTAPVGQGDILGICKLYLKGKQIGSVNMVAEQTINIKQSWIASFAPLPKLSGAISSKWKVFTYIFLLFIILYISRRRLEEALKRIILFLLRNKIPNHTKNHRF